MVEEWELMLDARHDVCQQVATHLNSADGVLSTFSAQRDRSEIVITVFELSQGYLTWGTSPVALVKDLLGPYRYLLGITLSIVYEHKLSLKRASKMRTRIGVSSLQSAKQEYSYL